MTESKPCAVVTGAARGIGRALAARLLKEGYRVVLSDVDEAALLETTSALGSPDAVACRADVSSAADCARLAGCAGTPGGIALWINNAGLARHRAIVDYTEAEIDLMLSVNLKGTILGSQAALRAMAPLRAGHIINIISTASLRGIPSETVYCAAKWGVRGFTQGLREEAAAVGVRVTALLPGGVDTGFWKDAVSRNMPTEDFLTAEQVADAVVALARMDASVVPQELVLRALKDRDFAHV
jgi:NAD(P)-dependent dehydrogenase (short-subunit alcohol dehydrogenase family)